MAAPLNIDDVKVVKNPDNSVATDSRGHPILVYKDGGDRVAPEVADKYLAAIEAENPQAFRVNPPKPTSIPTPGMLSPTDRRVNDQASNITPSPSLSPSSSTPNPTRVPDGLPDIGPPAAKSPVPLPLATPTAPRGRLNNQDVANAYVATNPALAIIHGLTQAVKSGATLPGTDIGISAPSAPVTPTASDADSPSVPVNPAATAAAGVVPQVTPIPGKPSFDPVPEQLPGETDQAYNKRLYDHEFKDAISRKNSLLEQLAELERQSAGDKDNYYLYASRIQALNNAIGVIDNTIEKYKPGQQQRAEMAAKLEAAQVPGAEAKSADDVMAHQQRVANGGFTNQELLTHGISQVAQLIASGNMSISQGNAITDHLAKILNADVAQRNTDAASMDNIRSAGASIGNNSNNQAMEWINNHTMPTWQMNAIDQSHKDFQNYMAGRKVGDPINPPAPRMAPLPGENTGAQDTLDMQKRLSSQLNDMVMQAIGGSGVAPGTGLMQVAPIPGRVNSAQVMGPAPLAPDQPLGRQLYNTSQAVNDQLAANQRMLTPTGPPPSTYISPGVSAA